MTEWLPFNANEYVKVRLTERGHEILREQREELRRTFPKLESYTPRQPDENGYTSFQLWDLMDRFGPHIGLGKDIPFHLDILVKSRTSRAP